MNLRAKTRNCESRHARGEDIARVGRRGRDVRTSSGLLSSVKETNDKALLGHALRRLDAKLLGASWCEKCRKQKELLAELIPGHWREHYVDCGSASRCLVCVGCATTPTWRVRGRRYPGMFDLSTLRELVGLQQIGSRQAVEDRVIDAIDAGDPLGGLKLGDLPVQGRHRRHGRRSGWAKRAAIRLASREEGKYWCEFGELLTPRVVQLVREAQSSGQELKPAGV